MNMKTNALHSRTARWPLVVALLTAIIGISISFSLKTRITQTETAKARLAAETLRENTKQELNRFAEVLESVSALFALSSAVDQAAMDEFIEKGFIHQHSILGTFGLTQLIDHSRRIKIERMKPGVPGAYRIVKADKQGSWIPSGFQSIYSPLIWQSQSDTLNIPIGFDFLSIPESAQTIRTIEKTHQSALVPSPTISSNPNNPSYWVFAPFEDLDESNRSYVAGVAVAALCPQTILNEISARATSATKLQLIPKPTNSSIPAETIRLQEEGWLYESSLEAINTQWTFKCTLPINATDRRADAALIIGLIITGLITIQLLFLANRTRKIEATVRARTEELHLANARLEENLHERAHLEEEMSELAARERRRIGRDLHDSLGQKLTGAVFLSRSLLDYFSNRRNQESEDKGQRSEVRGQKSEIRGQPPSPKATAGHGKTEVRGQKSEIANQKSEIGNQETHAKTLNETLKSSVAQVRSMARGLAPVTLNDESLGETLAQLAEEMTGLYGVSCEALECAALPSLNRKTKEQLYLIAREAVNNAARHAQAGRVTLRLTRDASGWKLSVEDDGKGLPEAQPAKEGMGLRIMRHRAKLIGAQFEITSAPDTGTLVTVTSIA
jgi:signal transduction histidine kinase